MITKWLYFCLNYCRRLLQRLLGASTIGVKGLVINPQHQVLLVEHTYISGWHLPGGGVDIDETPIEALIRELKEEAAVHVLSPPTLFAIYSHLIKGARDFPILYIIKDFEVRTHPLSKEIKQARWFDVHELPNDTTEQTRQRIIEYFQGVTPRAVW